MHRQAILASGLVLSLLAVGMGFACAGLCRGILPDHVRLAPGLDLRVVRWHQPRRVQMWTVRIDLGESKLEVLAAAAADPDGDGPLEAVLTDPLRLATESRAMVLINANPWGRPDWSSGRWCDGEPVQISGLMAQAGAIRSPAEA